MVPLLKRDVILALGLHSLALLLHNLLPLLPLINCTLFPLSCILFLLRSLLLLELGNLSSPLLFLELLYRIADRKFYFLSLYLLVALLRIILDAGFLALELPLLIVGSLCLLLLLGLLLNYDLNLLRLA